MDCLFCKIIAGDIPSKKAYEDDVCFAFHDIAPQSPVHILVVPKKHIESAAALTEADADVAGHIMTVIPKIASGAGLTGFRIVSNAGPDARQSVPHLHFHILGGAELSDKMA